MPIFAATANHRVVGMYANGHHNGEDEEDREKRLKLHNELSLINVGYLQMKNLILPFQTFA